MKRAQAQATAAVVVDIRRRPPWRAGGAEKPFAVECQKATTGAWTIFSRYGSREEAHAVANRLRALGQPTRVVALS